MAYQDYHAVLPGSMYSRPHWIITHVGLSAHAHNIVHEVEVHGWLLSGIEELTIERLHRASSTHAQKFLEDNLQKTQV